MKLSLLGVSFLSLAVGLAATGAGCATDDEILGVERTPDAGTVQSYPDAGAGDGGAPLGCGDGVLDDGEGCDDGNLVAGDGCSPACVVEAEPIGGCPGIVVPLTSPSATTRVGSYTGTTAQNGAAFDSAVCGGGTAKDAVHAVTSDITGVARIRVDAAFDALVAARTDCSSATTELACKKAGSTGRAEMSVPVAAGQTLYLVVDGQQGASGTYRLDVEIGETSCGDGIAVFPEQCDDANLVDGDGCSATCQLEGVVSPAGTCPGAPFTIVGNGAAPVKVSFAGDTSLLSNTMGSFGCSTASSGKDQAYAITPTMSGAITAELRASYQDAHMHVRKECFSSATEVDCRSEAVPNAPLRVSFPVTAQNTYFLFADAKDAKRFGPYTLDVTFTPPTCGNGILETPEQCDDGNVADGDGCAATCALEPMTAAVDTCPGEPITLAGAPGGPMTWKRTASTSPLGARVRSCSNTLDRKDAVYSFVAPYNGYVKAKAKGAFNVTLDLRSTCVLETASAPPSATSLSCGKADGGNGEERVEAPIVAGTTYFLVVEGSSTNTNKEGPFELQVDVEPAVCGNSRIEGGETCDDGALDPGDGCSASCVLEPTPTTRTTCANAEALALTETSQGVYEATASGGNWNLPGGGYFTAPCAGAGKEAYFTVTPPLSGVIVAKVDANYNVSTGVRPACPPNTSSGFLTCSNKSAGPGNETFAFAATANTKYWIIVDAPGTKDLGRYDLKVTLKDQDCGDGIVGGVEECDDGNVLAGDGCSAACKLEPLAGIDTCPGHTINLTGTGTATRTGVVSLSTASLAADYGGTCGGSGRDGVVAVKSDVAGTLTAQLTSTWASVLYAREMCSASSTELECEEANLAKPNETVREITLPVLANVPVYLFVDALGTASGPATLSLTVTP